MVRELSKKKEEGMSLIILRQCYVRLNVNIFIVMVISAVSCSLQAQQAQAQYDVVVDQAVPQRHRYDGRAVEREHIAVRHRTPRNGAGRSLTDNVESWLDEPIQLHEHRRVVYIQPMRLQNNTVIARDQRIHYRGLYNFRRELISHEKCKVGPLFYRPEGENALYYAYATQQRWERTDHTVVDFLIVSYNPLEKIRFIDDATTSGGTILNENLPEPGLYELVAIDNAPNSVDVPAAAIGIPGARAAAHPAAIPQWTNRWEKWRRLEADGAQEAPQPIQIRAPHGVASIPGLVPFALNEPFVNAQDDITVLQREKEAADRDVDAILHQAGDAVGSVIITGPSGCGKTTFINCYANNPCQSRRRRDGLGWELYFPAHLANFTVGYGGGAQTTRPAYWQDTTNHIVLCDNPGDDDTNGPLRDIVNASMIYRMFQNPAGVKLLFTVEEAKLHDNRSKPFIDALEALIASFESEDDLRQMMHLLITKHEDNEIDIPMYLRFLLEGDPTANPPIPQDPKLTGKPRLINLIRFLVQHPERVSTAPRAPRAAGNFTPDLRAAKASILQGPFARNPLVRIKIKENSQNLVKDLARRLNEDVAHYLRTDGAQKILEYCRGKIEEHTSNAADLRLLFTGLATRLKNISAQSTPEAFLQVFEGAPATPQVAAIPQLFNPEEMRAIITNLRFLKTLLPHTVHFTIDKWKDALTSASDYLNTIGKIETLAKKPQETFNDGVLSLKGIFVGASDVEAAISQRNIKQKNLKKIIIHALNTWFIEQSMKHNEANIEAIAPRWKVTPGNKTITISGLKGENGAEGAKGRNATDSVTATPGHDGNPGKPGHNAGSFFGKLFVPRHIIPI